MDVWNVYLGQGKHEDCLRSMKEGGNVVWLGDFNTWSRRWGGEEEVRNREGELVESWLDEWGLKVLNKVGKGTRYEERSGKERVLDLMVVGGGVKGKCDIGEGAVGMNHKVLEVEVEMEGWMVEEKGWKKGAVDWVKFRGEIKLWGGKRMVLEEGKISREKLEEVIEELEMGLKLRVDRCKGSKKWESGRKI